MMKVRVAGWMPKGPVGELTVTFLDHRSKRQAQRGCLADRSESREVHGRHQLESIAVAANLQSGRLIESGGAHAGAVVIEVIRRPVERGREIELVVAGSAGHTDESLEAGMSP